MVRREEYKLSVNLLLYSKDYRAYVQLGNCQYAIQQVSD